MVHSSQLRVYKIVTIAVAHFKIMLSLSDCSNICTFVITQCYFLLCYTSQTEHNMFLLYS